MRHDTSFRFWAQAMLGMPACRRLLSTAAKAHLDPRWLLDLGHRYGTYGTFADAWRAAAVDRYAGHDHPANLANHLRLAEKLRASDYAALYWLSCIDAELRIFDFGGNVGNLYYSYIPYLPHRSIEWTVCDLPTIVEAGRAIAHTRGVGGGNSALHFTDRPAAARGCNVVLASGALHYWEGSVESWFETLACDADHVLINRTPIHPTEPSFITVQRVEHFAVPCVVRNLDELLTAFRRLGYSLINQWEALELSIRMPLFPEKSVANYSGFYFRKAASLPHKAPTSAADLR